MFLERRISKVENAGSITDNYGKRWILSPTAILHIQLSDQSLNVIVPEIPYYKEPVYVKSPLLKQVIASALDSATFFQLNNKDEWMLADGQRAPESQQIL